MDTTCHGGVVRQFEHETQRAHSFAAALRRQQPLHLGHGGAAAHVGDLQWGASALLAHEGSSHVDGLDAHRQRERCVDGCGGGGRWGSGGSSHGGGGLRSSSCGGSVGWLGRLLLEFGGHGKGDGVADEEAALRRKHDRVRRALQEREAVSLRVPDRLERIGAHELACSGTGAAAPAWMRRRHDIFRRCPPRERAFDRRMDAATRGPLVCLRPCTLVSRWTISCTRWIVAPACQGPGRKQKRERPRQFSQGHTPPGELRTG